MPIDNDKSKFDITNPEELKKYAEIMEEHSKAFGIEDVNSANIVCMFRHHVHSNIVVIVFKADYGTGIPVWYAKILDDLNPGCFVNSWHYFEFADDRFEDVVLQKDEKGVFFTTPKYNNFLFRPVSNTRFEENQTINLCVLHHNQYLVFTDENSVYEHWFFEYTKEFLDNNRCPCCAKK